MYDECMGGMEKADPNLMTEGSVWRKMITFAMPLFLGNLFQQLYNTADSLIVGNMVSSQALAAVSSSGNLIFLTVGFFTGLSVGASVVIARFAGANDVRNETVSVHSAVILGLISSILLTIIGVTFAPTILRLIDTPADVFDLSVSYFRIYFSGSVGMVMYNSFVSILQANGDSKHPLMYLIISSITNVIGDLILIGVFHMGVEGAALATIISQALSAILCLIHLIKTDKPYRIRLACLKWNTAMITRMLRYGLPSGFQNMIISLSNVFVQSFINMFGSDAMAGIGAYTKIEGFAFLPTTCFSMTLTTFVAQNLGAKKPERARQGVFFGIACTLIVSELIGLGTAFFAPSIIGAFNPSAAVIAYGVGRAQVVGPFFFLVAYTHTMAAVLRGAGKPVTPTVVFIACWCVVRIVVVTICRDLLPVIDVIYWIYPFTWTLSATTLHILYKKLKWE